ncbi:MAG: DUF2520 domain-containing protein [Legionellaceae bacterium]|nr:DUF2520 domain-containing protein [Legionellaceae bacterium]
MYINLIGPGRLGKALAASLLSTGEHELLSVYHPQITSAQDAIRTLGHGTAINNLKLLPKSDITLIICPDDKMPGLIKELAEAMIIQPNSIVMHASGILSSDILMPLKQQGASIASLHPLKAFREASTPDTTAFQDVHCSIEGDDKAIKILTPLWQSMGAHIFRLNSEKKTTYHAAAVMASNYLVTLAAEANKLFETSGVPSENAREICIQLMQTSLDNLKQAKTPKQALTGPLVRGDLQTIQKHLDAIKLEQTKRLYCAAGLATLPLTDPNKQDQKKLKSMLYNKIYLI